MATDTVTVRLPDDIYRRIERLSSLTGSPMEGIIVRMLASSLPPLPDDFAPATRDALERLEHLSDSDLAAFEVAKVPLGDYVRFTDLRERRADGVITAEEQAELERLQQSADTLTLQKAYAAVLLKWRRQARASQTPNGDTRSDA